MYCTFILVHRSFLCGCLVRALYCDVFDVLVFEMFDMLEYDRTKTCAVLSEQALRNITFRNIAVKFIFYRQVFKEINSTDDLF